MPDPRKEITPMQTIRDCKTIQPDLSQYVDGTLPETRAWNIKMHVASCAVCDQIVRDFTQTTHLLSSMERREPAANFEAALARRLADHVLAPPRTVSLWDKMRDSISARVPASPRFRPVYLAPVAFAALAPLVFWAASPKTAPPVPQTNTQMQAAPQTGANAPANALAKDATLDDLLNDHAAYASSEPLADPAGMLAAQSLQ